MTDDLEAQRRQLEENRPRSAWAWGRATSTGTGTYLFKKPIKFDVSFYQKPFIAYGYEVIEFDPDGEFWPQSAGFVHEWVRDERDDYVGAYVGVTVTVPDPGSSFTPDPAVIEHSFTFSAMAWKSARGDGTDLPEA